MSKAVKVFEKFAEKPYMSDTKKNFAAGGAAAFASTGLVFPLDTFTTGHQSKLSREFAAAKKKLNIRHFVKNPKDIPKLYKGIQYKWLKTIPGMAITFGTFAATKHFLDKKYTSTKPYKKGLIKSAKVIKVLEGVIKMDPTKKAKVLSNADLFNPALKQFRHKQLKAHVNIDTGETFGKSKTNAWDDLEKDWQNIQRMAADLGQQKYTRPSYTGFGTRRPFSSDFTVDISEPNLTKELAQVIGLTTGVAGAGVGVGALINKYKTVQRKKARLARLAKQK